MLGSDDVLACFIAGNAFTWDDWFRVETEDDSLQPTIDMLLNVAIFMWFGAVCPWHQFVANDVIPIYRLIPLGIMVLLFRRLPMMLGVHKSIHQIEDIKRAGFMGFFGPIGVSAIFYLYISRQFLRETTIGGVERADAARLAEIINVVVWFLVMCSVFVHGLSIPLGKLGFYLPRTLSTAISSDRVSPAVSMPHIDDSTEPEFPRIHIHHNSKRADERSLMRSFRRRRMTTSERGEVPEGLSWIPRVLRTFGQHVLADLKRERGKDIEDHRQERDRANWPEGVNKQNGESLTPQETPPGGWGGARPEISGPRNGRIIGRAINHPSSSDQNADAEPDGPRVHVTSPPETRRTSIDMTGGEVVTESQALPMGWQRSIRFGDEPPASPTTRSIRFGDETPRTPTRPGTPKRPSPSRQRTT